MNCKCGMEWKEQYNDKCPRCAKPPAASDGYSFEAIAIKLNDGETGAWTDGIGIFSDNAEYAAYKLKQGKKYRITIQKL